MRSRLYEGVEIEGEGTVGLITYLRTDSTRVSEEAEAMAAEFIESHYGKEYLGGETSRKKTDRRYRMPMRRSAPRISEDFPPL